MRRQRVGRLRRHARRKHEGRDWRVVRSALPDRGKTCLGREEFVRDVWPALWGAFGERWRSKQ